MSSITVMDCLVENNWSLEGAMNLILVPFCLA